MTDSKRLERRSVVLLSSGLDSTVNLFEALRVSEVVLALTFDYGQRAAVRETEHAAQIAKQAHVAHRVVNLSWFSEFTKTSLVNREAMIPVRNEVAIDDLNQSHQTAKSVWVPNRNGIFLNIAAAFAEGLGANWIVPGFNAEEAATFPDNTDGFLNASSECFKFSTSNHVVAVCFTTFMNKTEIVRRGRALGVPFEMIWPCYFGELTPCGECESCLRFSRAVASA